MKSPEKIKTTTTNETNAELKSLSRADIIKQQKQSVDDFNKKQIEENIHARYHYAFPTPQEVRENPELAISDHFSIDGEIPTIDIDNKKTHRHLRVISFNMLYPGYFSGFDPFMTNNETMTSKRASRVMDVVISHQKESNADIIALQELFLSKDQLRFICERLQENALEKEEKNNWEFILEERIHLGIVYNSQVLQKITSQTAFEKSLIVEFKLDNNQHIIVINVHLQHEDNPNLTIKTIKDIISKSGTKNENIVILGDFNSRIYLPLQAYLRGEKLNFEETDRCISSLTPWQFSKKLFKSSENKKEYRPVGPSIDSTNGIFFSKNYEITTNTDKLQLEYGQLYIKKIRNDLEYTILTPSLLKITDKIKESELPIYSFTTEALKKSLKDILTITSKRGHTQEKIFYQAEIKTYHPVVSNLSILDQKKLKKLNRPSSFQEKEMRKARYLLHLDCRLETLPILLNKTVNDVWADLKNRDKNKNFKLLALAINFFGNFFVGMEVSEKLYEEIKNFFEKKCIFKNYELQFHFKDIYQSVDSRPNYNIYIEIDYFFELYHIVCYFLNKEQIASYTKTEILDQVNDLYAKEDINSAIKNHQWVSVESFLIKEGKITKNFLYDCLQEIDTPSRLALLWRHFSPQQQYELLHFTDDRGFGPIHWVIEDNKIPLLDWLSQQPGLDWNIAANNSFHRISPLHLAVIKKNIAAVKILLQNRTDLFALDREGYTPLHYASFYRDSTLVTLLREANYQIFGPSEISTDLLESLKSADTKSDAQMMRKSELSFKSIQQSYESILAHASPKLISFGWCLMRLSEIYLINQNYTSAMVYATGAYRYHQKFMTNNPFANQMQRILIRYLKEQCQLNEIPAINFIKYTKKLEKHRRLIENVFKNPAFKRAKIPLWLKNNTAFFIEIIADLFKMAIKLLNENPPTRYALLGLGSLSRSEMCPYSDLECALLLEKIDNKIIKYFGKVISIFELLVISLGETELYVRLKSGEIFYPLKKGFHLDPNNPLFSGFTGTIKNFLEYHIQQKEEDYLHSHMLRTVFCIVGDEKLVKEYEREKQKIFSSSSRSRLFFSPSKGQETALNSMRREIQQLLNEKKNTQDISKGFNIKEEWCRLPTQWIGHLALYYGCTEQNTFDRLDQLRESEILNNDGFQRLKKLMLSIFYLRISAHFYYACENEHLYLPSYLTLMRDEESAYIITDLEILYNIQKISLPMEVILKKFVENNGDIDLKYESFAQSNQLTNQLKEAKHYEQYYDWERAEDLYHRLIRTEYNEPLAWANFISFYGVKNEILERDRIFLQNQIDYQVKIFLELMIISGDHVESYYPIITQELDAFLKALPKFPSSVNKISIEKSILAMQKNISTVTIETDEVKSNNPSVRILDELKEADQLAQLIHKKEQKYDSNMRKKSKLCHERIIAYQKHLKNQNNLNLKKKILIGLIHVLRESHHELSIQKENLKNDVRKRLTQFVKTWQEIHYYLKIYKALPYELQNYFREQLVACQQERILIKNQEYTLVFMKIHNEEKIEEIIQKKEFPKRPTLFKQDMQFYIYGLSGQGTWELTHLNETIFKNFKFPNATKSFLTKKIPKEIYDEISEKNGHNPNQAFLRNLLKELNKYPDQKTQQIDWSQYKLRWQLILEACIENKKMTPPCLVSTLLASKNKCSLKKNIFQKIFTDNFKIREHKLYASQSDIFEIELKIDPSISLNEKITVYFKTRPEMPGMSFLVELIHYYIINHGTSRCELIRIDIPGNYELCLLSDYLKPEKNKLYIKEVLEEKKLEYLVLDSLNQPQRAEISLTKIKYDKKFSLDELKLFLPKILKITTQRGHTSPGNPIPILLSETIHGENLHDVLEKNPEKLTELSHKHFSELALIAMLINPGDGKPSNYILVQLPNGKYTLVSVDHDHAFFPAYLKETKNKEEVTTLQVKTILFCLDAMNHPINPDARDLFCERIRPIQVLRMILQQAQIQNNYYSKLFDSKSTNAFHKNRGIGNCTIPIPIKKGDMVTIYQKMCLLQNYLQNHPNATLLQCLMQVEPRVGLTYARALKELKDPVERLTKVGNFPISPEGYMLTASRALKSLRISESILADIEYFAISDLSPEEGLSELDMLAYQQTQLKDVQNEVQYGKFDRFSTLLSSYDQERIICGDFDEKSNRVGLSSICWQNIYDYEFLSLSDDLKLEIDKFYITTNNSSFIKFAVIDSQGIKREDLIDIKKEFNQFINFSNLSDLKPFFPKILKIAARKGYIRKSSVKQLKLLELLKKIPFRKLNLAGCHSLDIKIAEQILNSSPELYYLNIDFNPIFNNTDLVALNSLRVLQILYLRGLPNLTYLNNLTLNHLHTLVIEHSENLLNIEIITPELLHLRAENCKKLKKFKFGGEALRTIDLRGNNCMDFKNFISEIKPCKNLSILELQDSSLSYFDNYPIMLELECLDSPFINLTKEILEKTVQEKALNILSSETQLKFKIGLQLVGILEISFIKSFTLIKINQELASNFKKMKALLDFFPEVMATTDLFYLIISKLKATENISEISMSILIKIMQIHNFSSNLLSIFYPFFIKYLNYIDSSTCIFILKIMEKKPLLLKQYAENLLTILPNLIRDLRWGVRLGSINLLTAIFKEKSELIVNLPIILLSLSETKQDNVQSISAKLFHKFLAYSKEPLINTSLWGIFCHLISNLKGGTLLNILEILLKLVEKDEKFFTKLAGILYPILHTENSHSTSVKILARLISVQPDLTIKLLPIFYHILRNKYEYLGTTIVILLIKTIEKNVVEKDILEILLKMLENPGVSLRYAGINLLTEMIKKNHDLVNTCLEKIFPIFKNCQDNILQNLILLINEIIIIKPALISIKLFETLAPTLLTNPNEGVIIATSKLFFTILTIQPDLSSRLVETLTAMARNITLINYFVFVKILKKMMFIGKSSIVDEFTAKIANIIFGLAPFDIRFALKRSLSDTVDDDKINLSALTKNLQPKNINQDIDFSEFKFLIDSVKDNITLAAQVIEVIGSLLPDQNLILRSSAIKILIEFVKKEPESMENLILYLENVGQNQRLETVNTVFSKELRVEKPLIFNFTPFQNLLSESQEEKKSLPPMASYPMEVSKFYKDVQSGFMHNDKFLREFFRLLENRQKSIRTAAVELFDHVVHLQLVKSNLFKLWNEISSLLDKYTLIQMEILQILLKMIKVQPSLIDSSTTNKIAMLGFDSKIDPEIQVSAIEIICQLGKIWNMHLHTTLCDYIQYQLKSLEGFKPSFFKQTAISSKCEAKTVGNGSFFYQIAHEKEQDTSVCYFYSSLIYDCIKETNMAKLKILLSFIQNSKIMKELLSGQYKGHYEHASPLALASQIASSCKQSRSEQAEGQDLIKFLLNINAEDKQIPILLPRINFPS